MEHVYCRRLALKTVVARDLTRLSVSGGFSMFGGTGVERRRREDRAAEGRDGVGSGEGCPPPQNLGLCNVSRS